MTVEIFLTLLAAFALITSLLTEAVKAFLADMEVTYASNIIVLIVAVAVGGIGTPVFYMWNHYEWTSLNIICIFLMMCANWLVAMVGYDKVMQAIAQLKQKG